MAEPYAYVLAVGIIVGLLAYLVWVAPRHPRRTATAVLALNVLLWLLGEIAVASSRTPREALLAIRATYLVVAWLPFTVHRLVRILDEPAPRHRLLAWVSGGFALVSAALLTSDLLIAGTTRDVWGFHRVSGPLFRSFSVGLFSLLIADIGLLVYAARHARDALQRVRCQHILFGVVANVVLAALDLAVLQPLGIEAHRAFTPPLGVTLAAATFIYATAHSRLMDVPTALRRSAIHGLLVATLLVPCLGASLLAEQLMTGRIALGPSFVTALLFCVAGFGFPRLRVSAERTLEHVLFGARADDRRLLRAASREVTTVLSLSTLADVTKTTLARAFDEVTATLWLRRGKSFVALDSGGGEIGEADSAAILLWADAASEPLVVTESLPGQDAGFHERGIAVVFALRVKNRTTGLLTLGPRGDYRLYTDDDLALVATLANQVAIALENARLYEELRESREQVQRASRLSAVGTLAAGVAHEIRNPLVAIRTFLQLLPHRLDDQKFLSEFRQLTLDEADRIARLTTELLTFARSHERNLSHIDMASIAADVMSLLQPEATKHEVELRLASPADVPAVRGDADQLRQVVLNVVLNAIQASPPGCLVTITTRTARSLRGEQQVRVEVGDQGCGVPEENVDAIFNPFFTTKDGAVGLGLSVAHQLADEHGGSLAVASGPGGGAMFTLTLPVAAADGDALSPPKAPPHARQRWGHELGEDDLPRAANG
jgi:signal transduction histidine kinase